LKYKMLKNAELEQHAVSVLGIPTAGGTDATYSLASPAVMLPEMTEMLSKIGFGSIQAELLFASSYERGSYHAQARSVGAFAEYAGTKAFEIFNSGRRLLALGGDHSASLGNVKAFVKYCREHGLRGGVVVIDAHADYNAVELENDWLPYDDESGNIHGQVAAAYCGDGHPALTAVLGEENVLAKEDLLLVGINALDDREIERLERDSIAIISTHELDEHGLGPALRTIESIRKRVDVLFVSVDTDSMDAGIGPGTPMVNEAGLSMRELISITKALGSEAIGLAPVIGIDVVEYSAAHDNENRETLRRLQRLVACLYGSDYSSYQQHMAQETALTIEKSAISAPSAESTDTILPRIDMLHCEVRSNGANL